MCVLRTKSRLKNSSCTLRWKDSKAQQIHLLHFSRRWLFVCFNAHRLCLIIEEGGTERVLKERGGKGERVRQEIENQVTDNSFGQVEELRAQLRIRNQRDVDISRRLRNGHNTIAKVLQQQQAAAASALEVLPSVDIIHSQMMNIFKAETDFRMQVMPRNNTFTRAREI